MIPAIVLAAGASVRMGQPKPLLRLHGETFVRRILATLREAGVTEIAVVVRPGADQVAGEIDAAGIGRAVVNADPDRGQLSSLLVGLDAVDGAGVDAVLVTLVDVPLISAAAVAVLLSRAVRSPAPIVRAVHAGRHGHPVVFKRVVFEALRRAEPAVGAKAVFRAHAVEDVEVGDAGVLQDIDTPQDYSALDRL